MEELTPQYDQLHEYEFYPVNLLTEYQQCIDEGLDIEAYKDVFTAVYYLPNDAVKKALGDALFEKVRTAKMRTDYPYSEPSDLPSIQALRKPYSYAQTAPTDLEDKLPLDRFSGEKMLMGVMEARRRLGSNVAWQSVLEMLFFDMAGGNRLWQL